MNVRVRVIDAEGRLSEPVEMSRIMPMLMSYGTR